MDLTSPTQRLPSLFARVASNKVQGLVVPNAYCMGTWFTILHLTLARHFTNVGPSRQDDLKGKRGIVLPVADFQITVPVGFRELSD